MKKLFFTLVICLFSMGAFASNGSANKAEIPMGAVEFVHQDPNVLPIRCVIKVTTIITIDHGAWTETITIVTYEPCPFGY